MPKELEREAQVFTKEASRVLSNASKAHHRNSLNSEEQAKIYQKYAKTLDQIASKKSGEKLDSLLSEFLQRPVGVGKDTSRAEAVAVATSKIAFETENAIPLLANAIGKIESEPSNFLSNCFTEGYN